MGWSQRWQNRNFFVLWFDLVVVLVDCSEVSHCKGSITVYTLSTHLHTLPSCAAWTCKSKQLLKLRCKADVCCIIPDHLYRCSAFSGDSRGCILGWVRKLEPAPPVCESVACQTDWVIWPRQHLYGSPEHAAKACEKSEAQWLLLIVLVSLWTSSRRYLLSLAWRVGSFSLLISRSIVCWFLWSEPSQWCFHCHVSSYCHRGISPVQSCAHNQRHGPANTHCSLLSPHLVSNPCKWAGWFTRLKMYIFTVCHRLCWIMSAEEQGRMQSWNVW